MAILVKKMMMIMMIMNQILRMLFFKTRETFQKLVSWDKVLPANCLSVFEHFVGLALKGLN